jgi:hypothetical protein
MKNLDRWTLIGMVSGLLLTLPCQADTSPFIISARPGSLNYLDGEALLNQTPLTKSALGTTFLNTDDVLQTGAGKLEILLTPGVFLRIGDQSAVRFTVLSLIRVEIQVIQGEAILEADELMTDNRIQVKVGDSHSLIQKPGLYRFTAGPPATYAVIAGKSEVSAFGQTVELSKGRQMAILQPLKKRKFDSKREDDLYAWSNERSEYEAAASYQSARDASLVYGSAAGGWVSGWLWNGAFDSWSWLPGGDTAFFSPFGYGFFSPGVVASAPLCYADTYGGRWHGPWRGGRSGRWAPLPINPTHPPAVGVVPKSPSQETRASAAAAQTFARTGISTARGGYIPIGTHMTTSRGSWSRGTTSHGTVGNGGHVSGWARSSASSRSASSGGFSSSRGGSSRGGEHLSGDGGGGGGGHASGGGTASRGAGSSHR